MLNYNVFQEGRYKVGVSNTEENKTKDVIIISRLSSSLIRLLTFNYMVTTLNIIIRHNVASQS